MKIVILGAKGMLGHDLNIAFGNFQIYPFGKEDLDIMDKQNVDQIMGKIKPDFVINAAAYTDVDGAESNFEFACKVNADGIRNLAKSCGKINSIVVHISTDYVFDGEKEEGYDENQEPNPVNAYGRSKLLGEKYLKESNCNHYLVRTSWLYGKNGKNFVDTIIRIANQKDQIEIVNDQKGCPTYTKDLSLGIKNLLLKKPDFGTYHLTNDGACTWFDFASKIMEIRQLKTKLKPIPTSKLNRAAKRPLYSVLINTKFPKLRHWEEALREYLM